MKQKKFAVLLVLLALVVLISSSACRTRSKKAKGPTTVPTTTSEAPAPEVTATVEQPADDFVRSDTTPSVTTENLSTDINEVNRSAQSRGWIRDVFFQYDASTLSTDAQDALATTASWLKSHPQYNLLIEGHTDERGTEQYNLALGDRRANTAKDYLSTIGIESGRLRTVSYGEERPFNQGSGDMAWAENRRAHFVLTGK